MLNLDQITKNIEEMVSKLGAVEELIGIRMQVPSQIIDDKIRSNLDEIDDMILNIYSRSIPIIKQEEMLKSEAPFLYDSLMRCIARRSKFIRGNK